MKKKCVKKVNIYMKNYKVTSSRNVTKEINKENNEKIYKNIKYIESRVEVYNVYKHENTQIYRYGRRKLFM